MTFIKACWWFFGLEKALQDEIMKAAVSDPLSITSLKDCFRIIKAAYIESQALSNDELEYTEIIQDGE